MTRNSKSSKPCFQHSPNVVSFIEGELELFARVCDYFTNQTLLKFVVGYERDTAGKPAYRHFLHLKKAFFQVLLQSKSARVPNH